MLGERAKGFNMVGAKALNCNKMFNKMLFEHLKITAGLSMKGVSTYCRQNEYSNH